MGVSRISRRMFIRAGAAASFGMSLGRVSGPALGIIGANERIRVGIIGPGDRGRSLMNELLQQAGHHNAELTAVCDLWSRRRQQAAALIRYRTGKTAASFRNTDELYDSGVVDAVMIATPDFSHAILCAEAIQAGMDVYVEKPLAHVMQDVRLVRESYIKSGRIVQVGTDRRSRGRQRAAADYVRSGRIGRIISVEIGCHVQDPKLWRREQVVATLRESETDWRRYQLNRPARPFDPRVYLEFRHTWPFSSGLPDQWLSQDIDTLAHVTGELYPVSCIATGAVTQWHAGRTNPDTFTATFDYASGLTVRYSAGQANAHGGRFARFMSDSCVLDLAAGTVTRGGGWPQHRCDVLDPAKTEKLPTLPDESHVGNWLACIRSRRQPAAAIEAGYAHSVAVAMAIRALQTGRRVTFDAASHVLA